MNIIYSTAIKYSQLMNLIPMATSPGPLEQPEAKEVKTARDATFPPVFTPKSVKAVGTVRRFSLALTLAKLSG